MIEKSVNILLVEDNTAEARLLRETLTVAKPGQFNMVHVRQLKEALQQLDHNKTIPCAYDVILLDLTLPDSQGLESLEPLLNRVPDLPIVVLTNTNDDEMAIEAVRLGAQDYLVKRHANMEMLGRSLQYAIERKQASEALRKANEELAKANERLQQEIVERQKAQEELQRSNAELEEFAYIVSHDLQQPLCTISSWAQMLSMRYQEKLDAKAEQYISYIVNGTERMNELIHDLLEYSRVGRAKQKLEPTDCDLLLNMIQNRLQQAIAESNAVITSDPLPTVMADSVLLGQVFQNLMANAIKYRGEERPKIHISATFSSGIIEQQLAQVGSGKTGKYQNTSPSQLSTQLCSTSSLSTRLNTQQLPEWIFSVRDHGIGIDPKQFDRIFLIFQRLHKNNEYPGSGIGLAVCQKIIQRHGGRIWVESEPGQGATFYFTIPALTLT